MKKIDIFSDIKYNDFKHINQMLFDELSNLGYEVRFLERFYMHPINFSIFMRLLNKITNKKLNKRNNIKLDKKFNVKRIINFPPSKLNILNILNGLLVRLQIKKLGDIAITFVPSPALNNLFNRYDSIIYYCVHDSMSQKYNSLIIRYEKELVSKSKYVFCDNHEVLSRLSSNNITSIFEYESNKIKSFVIPAPIPNEFFFNINKSINIKYDYVYFGSFHKDIDNTIFKYLHNLGLSILCITSENEYFEEIKHYVHFHPLVTDYLDLIFLINQSQYILLPYKNSEFMNTITPAKINQCIALKKKIICTNDKLSDNYGLNYACFNKEVWTHTLLYHKSFNIEEYSIKNISKHIVDLINN